MEHVGIGLISFGENGDVELINETTKELLGMNNISNVSVIMDRYPLLIPVFIDIHKVGQLLVKIKEGPREMELLVKSQGLRFNDSKIKLVSLQNIKPELEQKELEAWKKLIRILRHEIMNSITPITTLTTAIKRCFKNSATRKPLNEITDLNVEDALLSAQVIEERSKGLINFVEKFRSITDVPNPKYSVFSAKPMFLKIEVLFTDELKSRNIEFIIDIENNDLQLYADEHLIEQVLINLVKNAIEAITLCPGEIVMKAFHQSPDSICIQVIDNGVGISSEDMDHIFMPSFSTKENGMGVGLSISKQIIQMHNGSLIANSQPGNETIMEICLPI
jgi:two-component system, NtrC family, nitrogen regulation sensor histidine kinase NtrY